MISNVLERGQECCIRAEDKRMVKFMDIDKGHLRL